MSPTLDPPIIGDGIVPGAVTVHGQASCKTCTGRDAYRRWCIGGGEAATACGKRVQRRCADNRVSGIPGYLRVVSVGHKDEQVLRRGGHRRSFRLLVDRTAIAGQRVGIVYA